MPSEFSILNPSAYVRTGRAWANILPRALALFFGGFGLLNVLGELRRPGFDLNLWWLDFRPLPPLVADGLMMLAAVCLLAFACRPPRSTWRVILTFSVANLLLLISLLNSAQFYALLARGRI